MKTQQSWEAHVDAWWRSGQSGREYAEERGICRKALYRWAAKVAKEEVSSAALALAREPFLPVRVLPSRGAVARPGPQLPMATAPTGRELSVREGVVRGRELRESASGVSLHVGACRVELARGFDEASLERVLHVVASFAREEGEVR